MLRFDLFGIPIGVQWMFWLTTAVLGGALRAQGREEWVVVLLWMMAGFLSILVHELGHALAARRYRLDPVVILHGFGGVTILPGYHLTRWPSIWVSFAGPLAGFCLGAAAWLVERVLKTDYLNAYVFLDFMWQWNIVWTCVNLLPIQPMDGGQIFRELLGPSRISVTNWVGGLLATGIALLAIQWNNLFLALMFGYFAWVNFRNEQIEGGVRRS